jgi:hypothetical protein
MVYNIMSMIPPFFEVLRGCTLVYMETSSHLTTQKIIIHDSAGAICDPALSSNQIPTNWCSLAKLAIAGLTRVYIMDPDRWGL